MQDGQSGAFDLCQKARRIAKAAVFTAVAPVTAVFLSVVFLDETFGKAQTLGIAAVALAILILFLPALRRNS